MFIVNFKLDIKKILLVCFILGLAIAAIVEFSNMDATTVSSKKDKAYDYLINETNFCEAIKNIHDDIDNNINKTIKISGFVFRMPDFKDTYFVCGRNVIKDSEDMVAGILCETNDASKLLDNEWVEITGIISKCDYNGEMPVIKIGSIEKITAPNNTFVTLNENN